MHRHGANDRPTLAGPPLQASATDQREWKSNKPGPDESAGHDRSAATGRHAERRSDARNAPTRIGSPAIGAATPRASESGNGCCSAASPRKGHRSTSKSAHRSQQRQSIEVTKVDVVRREDRLAIGRLQRERPRSLGKRSSSAWQTSRYSVTAFPLSTDDARSLSASRIGVESITAVVFDRIGLGDADDSLCQQDAQGWGRQDPSRVDCFQVAASTAQTSRHEIPTRQSSAFRQTLTNQECQPF